MHQALLHITNVSKTYPSGFNLRIDRLAIEEGERVGLVGNNGAGKTTMMLLTLGLLAKDAGQIRVNGFDVHGGIRWRRLTASYLGESSLITFLTPREYWAFVARAYELKPEELEVRLEEFEDFIEVPSSKGGKLIRELSAGNRKKVGLLAAMLVRPRLLVLDEPFANLDPRSQNQLQGQLRRLNDEFGCTLFISSHDLPHVVEVGRRIVVVDRGRIVQDAPVCPGSLRDLRTLLTRSEPGAPALT